MHVSTFLITDSIVAEFGAFVNLTLKILLASLGSGW